MIASFLGNLQLGSSKINDILVNKGVDYVFQDIKPLLQDSEIVFGNFECLFTKKIAQDKDNVINPEYIKDFKQVGFNAFHVLNKYSYDYGISIIGDNNINLLNQHVNIIGNYDDPSKILTLKGLKLGFLGYAFYKNLYDVKDVIQDIKKLRTKVDRIIMSVSYGKDNYMDFKKKDKKLFESFCDLGVDLIIGLHPFNPSEPYIYEHSIICPSLGSCLVKTDTSPFTMGQILKFEVKKEEIVLLSVNYIMLNSQDKLEIVNFTNNI